MMFKIVQVSLVLLLQLASDKFLESSVIKIF